jgi:glycosyltransferase involved in cell wall biosynthesis
VPVVAPARGGRDLVVNVTGLVDRFLALAPELDLAASRHGARVVAILSASARQRVRAAGLDLVARSRDEAREALAGARAVVHLSDGARFPSFAFAVLAAGVPTIARSTPINRELLEGAAALIEHDHEWPGTLAALLEDGPRRALLGAAGVDRARDYAPATAARAYAALYGEVVRGWRP